MLTRKMRLRAFRPWMPEGMRDELVLNRPMVIKKFSPSERHALTIQKPIPVSEWAERYRILESAAVRGPWKNIFTPYLTDVMDVCNMPGVETVIMCKSPQTGGSECGHNLVGYCIDRLPGPVMYVFPDENTARENARDRIIPMIMSSPKLSRYLTGNPDDVSTLHVKLAHMSIHLAWSGSVSRLGNKPIKILILDELDKYANPTNEARSEVLAEKRTTTWRSRRKIIKISTPTTEDGPIWQAFTNEANARFRYWVRCPDCGDVHLMAFDGIYWPNKDTDKEPGAETVYSQRLATYVCPKCGSHWDDQHRDLAVRAGFWREEETGKTVSEYVLEHKPKKVGFHIPAWISYFVSLSEVARAYLRWKETGNMSEQRDFANQYLAEPWHEQFEKRTPEEILLRCDDRPRGSVPGLIDGKRRVAALIAGVDTQLRYFRYVIRAIGFGETAESWLVQEGVAPTFQALDDLFFKSEYRDVDGNAHKVRAVMIDAMGEQRRTAAVYDWASRNKGRVFPSQGVHHLIGGTWRMSQLEYFPTIEGRTQKISGGLTLYRLDSTFYKNMLASRITVAPTDPGAFHLHNNHDGQLDAYAREMTAEVWDSEEKGGTWVNERRKPNHAWDCEYLVQALADIMQIKKWSAEPNPEKKKQPARPMPQPVRMSVHERLMAMKRRGR